MIFILRLKAIEIFILLLILSSFESSYAQKGHVSKIVLQLDSSINNPRNSEGDFIELKDGRILYVYSRFLGSSTSDHAPAQLMGRYSKDQGKSWTKDDHLIVDQEGGMNVMSVSLLRLQNGSIALFYLRKNSLVDCVPMMRISNDEGVSWSEAVECISDREGYFVVNNDRVIQLNNGRILMPTSLHRIEGQPYSNKGVLRAYYSDDNGFTWNSGKVVSSPDTIITQEPGVVELTNGSIMMFIRASSGVQYQSFSSDKGETWSYAEPTTIMSPISPASIKRIPKTNDLLLVWNNNGAKGSGYFKGKRTPLTVAISKDEGKVWENFQDVENDPNGTFCYIAIHFTKKHVLLGYATGTGLTSSLVRRLSLKKLK